jgi:hypothetical protein
MMRERSGWRELDLNHRSRGRPRRSRGIGSRLRRLSVGGESSRADMSSSRNLLSRGTDSSNPASSSEESAANSCRPPCKGASHFGAAHPDLADAAWRKNAQIAGSTLLLKASLAGSVGLLAACGAHHSEPGKRVRCKATSVFYRQTTRMAAELDPMFPRDKLWCS